MKTSIIQGGIFQDNRGVVSFFNDFDMSMVKRFYTIVHSNTSVIRAWQGHKVEHKWFVVTKGAFKLAVVKIDNWNKPSETLSPEVFLLNANDRKVLFVPAGYANGFKAVEPNSKVMVFSSLSLKDSKKDTVRFDATLWVDW